MATDDDTLTRSGGLPSPSAIAGMFRHTGKGPPFAEPEAVTMDRHGQDGPESFDPESADYKACGWAGNKTLPSLRIVRKDGTECACHYSDLDTAYPAGCEFTPSAPGRKGNVITLRFAGRSAPFLVVLEGVRLRRVWELLMGHKTPWVHELPAEVSFTGGDEPVIRSIAFRPVPAEAR